MTLECQCFIFSYTAPASQVSGWWWKMPCIPWGSGHLLCDQVTSVSGHLPRPRPTCGGVWWAMGFQACETPSLLPETRHTAALPGMSQVPPVRSATTGGGGVGWERLLVHLWLCPSLSYGDYQILAALPLDLRTCHWD